MSKETYTIIIMSIFVLYWAVLIGSSVWAAAVRYVSDGDKNPNRLSTWLAANVWKHKVLLYKEGDYQNVETEGVWIFYGFIVNAALLFLWMLGCSVIHKELGTLAIGLMVAALGALLFLKLCKFVYAIRKKLHLHTEDKNAHR